MSFRMKGIAGFLVFTIACCTLNRPETTKIAWLILLPVIWIIFALDVTFLKKNKVLEYELCKLEREEQDRKIHLPEMLQKNIPDEVLHEVITEPSKEISLPLLYYLVMTIISITILAVFVM